MSKEGKIKDVFSVGEFAREIDRSTQYVRALIKTGVIEYERLNRFYILRNSEVERVKRERPVVTREGYGRKA